MRIFVDACTVIYHLEEREPWASRIRQQVSELSEQDELVASRLVRLECLVHPFRANDEDMVGRFREFFGQYEMLPITDDVFDCAIELRAHHGLKTVDALHLATAQHHRCDEFWTNDNRFARARKSLTIRAFGP